MAERKTRTPKTTSTGMRAYIKGNIREGISIQGDLAKKYDRDFERLGGKGFKDKYGVSYNKAQDMLAEGGYGDAANKNREKYGADDTVADTYDNMAKRRAKAQGKAKGGMAVKKYAKGGYANCGASVPPNGKSRK